MADSTDADVTALLRRIWEEQVPESGQAPTVQVELVRALYRLRLEAYRNGNANWDRRRHGYPRLHRFLRRTLRDRSIPRGAALDAALASTGRGAYPEMDDAVWATIGRAVAAWIRAHPDPVPRAQDRALEV